MRFILNTRGSYARTETALKKLSNLNIRSILEGCGRDGVNALSAATPVDTGLAAQSWDYEVSVNRGVYRITWVNHDVETGFPVVIMLQYGYGTGTGGYVKGQDFINPAIRPIFDRIAETAWKAVTSV